MWLAVPIVAFLAVATIGAVIVLGRRRRALAPGAAIGLSLLALVWLLGYRLRAEGWHDIDGWVDCYPSCGGWHLVGLLLFWAPLVVAGVLVVSALIAAARIRHGDHS